MADRDLLARARDELYLAKALVREMRNRSKTLAAALDDSETRIDWLITDLEQEPHAKEAQGHDTGIAQQDGMEEAQRRRAAQGRAPVGAR